MGRLRIRQIGRGLVEPHQRENPAVEHIGLVAFEIFLIDDIAARAESDRCADPLMIEIALKGAASPLYGHSGGGVAGQGVGPQQGAHAQPLGHRRPPGDRLTAPAEIEQPAPIGGLVGDQPIRLSQKDGLVRRRLGRVGVGQPVVIVGDGRLGDGGRLVLPPQTAAIVLHHHAMGIF